MSGAQDSQPRGKRAAHERTSRSRRRTLAVIGAGVLAVAAALGFHQLQRPSTADSVAAAATPAVATPPAAPTAVPTSTPAADGAPAAGTSTAAPATPQAITTPTAATVEGTVIAASAGPVFGDPANGLVTYTVEVMPALGDQLQPLLAVTDTVFGDGERGWTARGGTALQRIADPDAAQIRIILASPAEVDKYCGDAGLDTTGQYSCWDGVHTMLNSDRWLHATPEFTDLVVYREYLVNHEFGHGLGYDHEYCAGPGEVAPVMQQQSISLQGCTANGWPYPA